MKIDITPVPKPRQTRSDKWRTRPPVMRYRAFADEIRLRIGSIDLNGYAITFGMPMPKSWSGLLLEFVSSNRATELHI